MTNTQRAAIIEAAKTIIHAANVLDFILGADETLSDLEIRFNDGSMSTSDHWRLLNRWAEGHFEVSR